MAARLCVKIKPEDNVAIAIRDLEPGTEVLDGVVTVEKVPQAHKIALTDIPKGADVVRYGVVLGHTLEDIAKGRWINEHMIDLPVAPPLDQMEYGTNIVPMEDLPDPTVTTWDGFRNPNGGFGGTRNILAIQTAGQCVEGVVNVALDRIKHELLPKYPHVDDVGANNGAYGCSMAINAHEVYIPQRILRNLVHHPHFGGRVMCAGLGCEKFTTDMLLDPEDNMPENVVILQKEKGFEAMISAIMEMAEKKLQILHQRRREPLPLSDLFVAFECGGSDAFSGVSANPSAGYASDMIVKGGGTTCFSEVTEVREAVYLIAQRCVSAEVRDKLAHEMSWYDHYLSEGGADVSANPSPGNKAGGLSNIVEKSMGSIAKSGTAPIVDVLSPGETPDRSKPGLIYAATPASDIVCSPCQLASGCGVLVFMTGRGTPYGLAATPVMKVCSRNEMKEQWPDIIDVNAGPVAVGEATIDEIGHEIFDKIIAIASGKDKPFTERYGLYNQLAIFNPAPIT